MNEAMQTEPAGSLFDLREMAVAPLMEVSGFEFRVSSEGIKKLKPQQSIWKTG
jgi:hypothetical protein